MSRSRGFSELRESGLPCPISEFVDESCATSSLYFSGDFDAGFEIRTQSKSSLEENGLGVRLMLTAKSSPGGLIPDFACAPFELLAIVE